MPLRCAVDPVPGGQQAAEQNRVGFAFCEASSFRTWRRQRIWQVSGYPIDAGAAGGHSAAGHGLRQTEHTGPATVHRRQVDGRPGAQPAGR